jgi:hypothetical protein
LKFFRSYVISVVLVSQRFQFRYERLLQKQSQALLLRLHRPFTSSVPLTYCVIAAQSTIYLTANELRIINLFRSLPCHICGGAPLWVLDLLNVPTEATEH